MNSTNKTYLEPNITIKKNSDYYYIATIVNAYFAIAEILRGLINQSIAELIGDGTLQISAKISILMPEISRNCTNILAIINLISEFNFVDSL